MHAGTGGGEHGLDSLVETYRRHERGVYAICRAALQNPADAEDAVQETFIRAARHLHEVDDNLIAAYLAVVARSVCSDEGRRRRRQGIAAEELRVEGEGEAPADPEEDVMERRLLIAVWEQLPRRDRALVLYRFAGYSYTEIGRRLGMSVGAVGISLMRARRRARRIVEALPALLLAPLRRRRVRRRPWASARALRTVARLAVAATAAVAVGRVVMPSLATLSGGGDGDVPPVAVDGGLDHVQAVAAVAVPGSAETMLLSGVATRGCAARSSCAVLYRSADGGRSWNRLPADGFAGGRLLAMPGPGAEVLLAASSQGLQRSDDGGATFRTVVDIPGPVAVAPFLAAGDVGVVIGSQPLWVYHLTTGALTVGPSLPAAAVGVDDLAAAGGRLLVAAHLVDPAHPHGLRAAVLRCDAAVCRGALDAGREPALHLAAAPTADAVIAYGAGTLWAARDGAVFRELALAPGDVVEAAAFTHDLPGGVAAVVGTPKGAALLRWSRLDAPAAVARPMPESWPGAAWILPLVGGSVLVAPAQPDAGGSWGVRCSAASPVTWRSSC